jgi:hypothetical protein
MDLETEIYQILRRHGLPPKKREEVIVDLLALINKQEEALIIDGVTTRFTFDCWYYGDGTPLKRYIDAENIDKAIEIFEEKHVDMGYDYPYE